ncbi:UNVERIFIED_CONTAM: F-box/LRR-repeat protein 14 [Sesamum angustifolium]|uniref:F-box/LRR-repeat protein 14 n=1 Tax=Sesamum angustifolium TaxID=2727405 RepID=A0AAW2LIG9_9LAMI
MDNLPEQVAWDILGRIKRTVDKNSVSLTCKRLHELDNDQRKCIRVGCGLNPANEALVSLCNRFQNLEKVEISYSADLHSKNSGFGILSVVVGCKTLNLLHLNRCLNITSMEWLEYLGKLQTLEDLCIKNCRAIGEGDLIKLGPSWQKLKRLQFEVDANYRYMKVYDRLAVDQWQTQWIPCDSMIELKLVNGIISPGRGLACVLGKCSNLEKIHLDMCVGVKDSDITGLARNSSNLRSISLRVPSDFSLPLLMNNPIRLTDECLEALAQNCTHLESVRLSFSDGEFPSFSSFTLHGILTLVQNCPIRELSLDHVYSFNDVGMEALCSAEYLQMLELSRCQEITDEGLQLVAQFPKLCVLKLSKCLGVTNDGLKPLVGSHKLKLLSVDDCPQISERGVHGAADSVTFKQDLSWMY